jgi:hypothetical protein
MVPDPAAVTDSHVFLAGRPPIAEFISFVRKSADGAQRSGPEAADSALAQDWRRANDALRELERSEAGWADSPPIEPLPPELGPYADQLAGDPAFRQTHGFVPTEIGLVELDRLVVFQKHINLAQVEIIKQELGPDPRPDTITRIALGLSRYSPPVRLIQSHDVFTFTCDSRDFRFLEPILVPPGELSGAFRGVPARCVALAVGFSPNCLGVIQAEQRLILVNGSHRAYALRELGITHVPCVIQKTSRPEELELIGHKEINQRAELYLRNPRPPLLKDYFDERLRRIVPVARARRLIRIQLRIDQSDVPKL